MAEAAEKIRELEGEIDRLRREMLYYAAEVENVRKLLEREVRLTEQRTVERLIAKLVSAYEQIENALNQSPRVIESPEQLIEGLRLVLKELWRSIEEEGVEVIPTVGGKFDPHLHEAVGFVETDEVDDLTIVSEVAKGYLLRGRVMRPSKVVVSRRADRSS
ncbi:MAG: nucleotide exchange factor GrpE [Aigarchaeota archaeon]|nr:nucleotide exchange factor GrpE [Aigarchaeota archaeon]MDW8092162.1 nucleotide exchange factor GrpE [Nitrososphaerota archaeon]